MKYLCTIYSDESQMATPRPDQRAEMMRAYEAFTAEVSDAGVMVGGDGLQPSSTATTIRVRDGAEQSAAAQS